MNFSKIGLPLTVILLAGSMGPASASITSADVGVAVAIERAVPAEGCTPTTLGYRCFHGPVDVPTGEMVQLNEFVAAPSEAGYITSLRATLVDATGDRIAHHMVHLHHAVWINPNETDSTCGSFGGLPNWDRFFASGKERTRVEMPEGYGYFWDNQPNSFTDEPAWLLTAHLDGMHGQDNVFVRLDLGFTPAAEASGYTEIDPTWLDVENCSTNPVFDVAKGSGRRGIYKKRWTYTMHDSGTFVGLGGHLHDGGLRLVLRNLTTGTHMFTSDAIYGLEREPWYLTKMTAFSGVPGLPVSQGDELELVAVYDSTHRWRDAMGIMVGAFVPAP